MFGLWPRTSQLVQEHKERNITKVIYSAFSMARLESKWDRCRLPWVRRRLFKDRDKQPIAKLTKHLRPDSELSLNISLIEFGTTSRSWWAQPCARHCYVNLQRKYSGVQSVILIQDVITRVNTRSLSQDPITNRSFFEVDARQWQKNLSVFVFCKKLQASSTVWKVSSFLPWISPEAFPVPEIETDPTSDSSLILQHRKSSNQNVSSRSFFIMFGVIDFCLAWHFT